MQVSTNKYLKASSRIWEVRNASLMWPFFKWSLSLSNLILGYKVGIKYLLAGGEIWIKLTLRCKHQTLWSERRGEIVVRMTEYSNSSKSYFAAIAQELAYENESAYYSQLEFHFRNLRGIQVGGWPLSSCQIQKFFEMRRIKLPHSSENWGKYRESDFCRLSE